MNMYVLLFADSKKWDDMERGGGSEMTYSETMDSPHNFVSSAWNG